VAAHDAHAAFRHAQLAAAEAVRSGAHREAAAFLQTALAHSQHADPHARARLLHRLSMEQYLTSRLDEAIVTIRSAIPLHEALGDDAGLAAAHDRTAVLEYYNGRRADAEAHADHAVRIARDSGALLEHSVARATRGFLAYLRNELELAGACATEASDLARPTGNGLLVLRAQLVAVLARLADDDGDGAEGARDEVLGLISQASGAGLEELASTGYSQLAYCDVEHRRLAAAGRVLEESLPFATSREIPICADWQTGLRARVRFGHGAWDAALDDVGTVLGQSGMPLTRLWTLLIAGLVPLRRGQHDSWRAFLDDAWRLSVSVDEPVRRLAVLSALAEAMWVSGTADERVTVEAVRDVEQLASTPGSRWAVGELATWLARLQLLPRVPEPLPEPYRLAFAGRHADAAAWWRNNGEPYAEALAWSDSPHPDDVDRAVGLLDRLGARGTVDRLRAASRSTAGV
jgi:hypothetical protein